jgi:hypothetical protein
MPLMLNVGLTRKVGLPNYSSVGAACNVQVELDGQLLLADPEALQAKARAAFAACSRAVADELARQTAAPAEVTAPAPLPTAGSVTRERESRSARPCTPSQVRTLKAMCRERHVDLEALLGRRYTLESPEDLSLAEASRLIDQLREPAQATA